MWFGRERGLMRHKTATGVTEYSIAEGTILALWAGGRDVWAVGSASTIVRYDGTDWRAVPPDRPLGEATFTSVWGSGPSDVWIAGSDGLLLHWNGQALAVERPFTDVGLTAIWGTGTDPWIVGEGGGVFRRIAGAWCNVWSGPRLDFSWIGGTANDDVWVGTGPRIFHWDGQAWRERSRIWDATGAIASTPDGQLWFMEDDQLIRWDGNQLDPVLSLPSGAGLPYYSRDVKVLGPTDIWTFTGPPSMVPVRWDGQMLVQEPAPRNLTLYDIGGPTPDRMWACGSEVLLQRQAGSWQPVASPSLAGTTLFRLWFRSATDGWAVGGGTTPVLHWDGTGWTAFTAAEVGVGQDENIYAVWGSGANDVWFANGYLVLHFDGTAFVQVPNVAGGRNFGGTVIGTGPSQAWIAGEDETIWSWNGTLWSSQANGTVWYLYSGWTTTAGDVFLSGENGILLHRRPGSAP